MGGHRPTVIALSLIFVGACSSNGMMTQDGTIGDAPLTADKGAQDQAILPDAGNPSSPKWKWAVSADGGDTALGQSVAIDSSSNSYVTGFFRGTANFGSTTLTAKGDYDIFVAKVDSGGKFVWAIPAGGSGEDRSDSIAVDGSGNSYITGGFKGTATFGSTTLTSNDYNIFVAKLDSAGKSLWAVSPGGAASSSGYSISVDAAGNNYVTGGFSGTATFGSTTLTSKGSRDLFVAKLDSSGKFVWAVSAGGISYDSGWSISRDGSGNNYVTGDFEGTATFGSTTLTSKGDGDIFVAKVDSSGTFIWAVSAGGSGEDAGNSIAVEGSGNSYITGGFKGTATFGSTTLSSMGDFDIFVAKVDSGGKFAWAFSAKGGGHELGRSIAVDGSGHSYVTGRFSAPTTFGTTTLTGGLDNLFVAKLDNSGKFVWAASAGGEGDSIAVDGSGNSYVAGSYFGTATFGSTTLTSKGKMIAKDCDIFVAKLDSGSKP